MPAPEDAEVPLLDALYQLIDVSQALGLHAPSPAERTAVRKKLRAVREHLSDTRLDAGEELASLRSQVSALVALLDREHDTERWRSVRASLVASHERLLSSLRTRTGGNPGGRYRVKPHNLRRSLFHAGSGVAWAVAYAYVFDRTQMLLALCTFLVLFGIDDAMRRWFPDRRGRFAIAVFRLLSRPSESAKIASSTWYTVGMLIGVLTLPDHAFLTGLLVLALADPSAALVGRRWGGRRLYRDKSVLGTATFFAVAMVITVVVATRHAPDMGMIAGVGTAIIIACAGTIAELLGDHVQDNVSILLATGITTALLL